MQIRRHVCYLRRGLLSPKGALGAQEALTSPPPANPRASGTGGPGRRGSPVHHPRHTRGISPFQLVCTGISCSLQALCSRGCGFCSDGADCGDLLAAGFVNFIQFGPIAEGELGAIRTFRFNLSLFLAARVSVSPYRALFRPHVALRAPPASRFLPPRQTVYARNTEFSCQRPGSVVLAFLWGRGLGVGDGVQIWLGFDRTPGVWTYTHPPES